MLMALLAILGATFAGTIGIGAVSSLIKNRKGGAAATEATPSVTEEKPELTPKRKKKKEKVKEETRETEPEVIRTPGERTDDVPPVINETPR